MKNVICFFISIFVIQVVSSQIDQVTIKGSVSDGISVLADVNIRSVEEGKGSKTDANGIYRISVSEGSTLKYSHIGYEDVEIQLEDYDRTLNIIMVPKVELLDDVTVTQKVKTRKTQKEMFLKYNSNPNLIKTKFGIQDKEISGTAMYVIEDKDINPVALNILGVVQGKVPGAKVRPNGNPEGITHVDDPNAVIYLRGNENPVIYDIDGQIFEDTPFFLNINDIKRIAVSPSLFSATLYGTIARGGVISINTKSGNFSPDNVDSPNYDQALIRGNTYENDAIAYSVLSNGTPLYLTELMTAETAEDAKNIYHKYLNNYKSSMYFVLDTYQYFYDHQKDENFADSIINAHMVQFKDNASALKALVYMYQEQGRFIKANEVYKNLFVLRPNYGQSYIDMATSYSDIGEFKKAASIYARYNYLLAEGFIQPNIEFDKIIKREYKGFLRQHGKELFNNRRSKKKIESAVAFYNTRLVFEWNDAEAEFDLQFVNPKGKYFNIENSLFADAERIRSQKIGGYAIEEHLIDDSMLGEWQVNVNYLGNKSLTPTYLKATVYSNYGSDSQQKEVKLFKLRLKNVNQKLFTISNSARIASN